MVSASKISFAVFVSRVLGVFRESIFAKLFGAGVYAEAYVVAFRIPNLLRDLFAEGALSSAFVPIFTRVLKQEGQNKAFQFGNLVLTFILLVTGLISLVGFICTKEIVWLMASGLSEEKYQSAIWMTQILIPTFTLISLSAVFMGMLNAQKHFFVPALAPALFNVFSVLSGLYLCFSECLDEMLAFYWCVFTVISTVVQLGCQIPSAWKTGWRPQLKVVGLFSNPEIRKLLTLMLPAVLGVAIVNVNVFVNTRFASNIEGGLAHLNYAFRIFYLPIGMFGVALGTVAATTVAEMLSEKKYDELRNYLGETLKLNWLLSLPCTLGLAVLSVPTVALLFERGQFTAQDTYQTSLVLCAYLVGLVPFTSTKILVPVFFALERSQLSLLASLAAVLTNFLFNYFTHQWFGAVGIALGISLATFVQLALLNYFLAGKIGALNWKDLGVFFAKAFGATLGMAWVTGSIFFGGMTVLKQMGVSSGSLFWIALWIFLAIVASVFVYFFLCQKFNLPEATKVFAVVGRLKKKLRF